MRDGRRRGDEDLLLIVEHMELADRLRADGAYADADALDRIAGEIADEVMSGMNDEEREAFLAHLDAAPLGPSGDASFRDAPSGLSGSSSGSGSNSSTSLADFARVPLTESPYLSALRKDPATIFRSPWMRAEALGLGSSGSGSGSSGLSTFSSGFDRESGFAPKIGRSLPERYYTSSGYSASSYGAPSGRGSTSRFRREPSRERSFDDESSGSFEDERPRHFDRERYRAESFRAERRPYASPTTEGHRYEPPFEAGSSGSDVSSGSSGSSGFSSGSSGFEPPPRTRFEAIDEDDEPHPPIATERPLPPRPPTLFSTSPHARPRPPSGGPSGGPLGSGSGSPPPRSPR